MGAGIGPEDVPRLRRGGVTGILSLQQTGPDIRPEAVERIRRACASSPAIAHRNVPIRDYDPHDLIARLPEALAAVRELSGSDRLVYVHCNEGVNRAPSVALGVLVLDRELPVAEALARVERAHPGARPYEEFVRWLAARAARG